MDATHYRNFADLETHCKHGRDFRIVIRERPASAVAIVAPHAGRIEEGTSAIARAIAAEDLNLYLFEGLMPTRNYEALHLTSHGFDEPQCLALVARCQVVVTVHGCKGQEDKVLLGGLDHSLKACLADALGRGGIVHQMDGHDFPATDPNNICNRGRHGRGAQLEVSGSLRRSGFTETLARSVRAGIEAYLRRSA
jgi:phage replication-related protein YjqB (UPF0714/DUF867 family)